MPRTKEFDPDEALDKAMHTFWAKGYYDTSVRDLVTSTGVGPYGLYSTFEDKHGLYLAALDRYRDTVTRAILDELESQDGFGAVQRAFEKALTMMSEDNRHIGCLMCMTAVELAPHDSQAADRVTRHMALLSKAFRGAVEQAMQTGEIKEGQDPKVLSEYLTATLYGTGVLLRAGQSTAYVKRYVRTALEGLR